MLLLMPSSVSRHLNTTSWPRVEFSAQSAVQGRVFVISRAEASILDEKLQRSQVSYRCLMDGTRSVLVETPFSSRFHAYLPSVAVFLPSPPPKEGSRAATMQPAKSAQTLQIKVLWPVSKATVHNECGLPGLMCAVAGLEFHTLA